MTPRKAIFLIAPILAWIGETVTAQEDTSPPPAHLFVLSGQSNMAGLDPARSFTPAVARAFGKSGIIVVKDAESGAPIHRWHHGWSHEGVETPENRGALYDRLIRKVKAATAKRPLASVTFVWMQGERDARMRWGAVYRESLEQVVARLGKDLGRDDIHCVIGRLSDFDLADRRYPNWTMVREAQVAFAAASPRRAWVDTDDLNDGLNRRGKMITNDLHYAVKGYDTLGARFAEKAIALIRANRRPHIVLVMADDMGYGDAGFTGHPFVKTPALDAMAREALVFDRFYAASPVCSPTRASVLTGRSPIRAKVPDHGRYMRPHEDTLAEALQASGYVTGLFGKFHLGTGQPDSPCNPGGAGFDEWIVGVNFFDDDPYLSRDGVIERRKGRGTVIAMDDALAFLEKHAKSARPTFTVVWFPSPHVPHREAPEGEALYDGEEHAPYYREITLLDAQVGRLRAGLREMGIAEDTILWFCSDNGGLVKATSGGRAKKGSIYEGGLRVPAIIEWPARKLRGRCAVPAFTCDMLPTLATMAGFPIGSAHPLDGIDLSSAISGEATARSRPMGFWRGLQGGQVTRSDRILKAIMEKQAANAPLPHDEPRMTKDVYDFPQFPENAAKGHAAWTDWPWKLHRKDGSAWELYHLVDDPMEARDLSPDPRQSVRLARMQTELKAWMRSVIRSLNGADYAKPR